MTRLACMLFGGVILIIVGWWIAIASGVSFISGRITPPGTFGDSFGGVTALFNGLAFAGIIITILLQRQELELQRHELRLQREETARLADAQERSARLFQVQALTMAASGIAECTGILMRNDGLNEQTLRVLQELRTDLQGRVNELRA